MRAAHAETRRGRRGEILDSGWVRRNDRWVGWVRRGEAVVRV